MQKTRINAAKSVFLSRFKIAVFNAWRRINLLTKIKEKKAQLIYSIKQKKKLAKIFVKLQMFVQRKKKHRVEKMLADKIYMIHIIKRWKKKYFWIKKIGKITEFINEHYQNNLLRKSISILKKYASNMKKCQDIEKIIAFRKIFNMKLFYFGKWVKNAKLSIENNINCEKINSKILLVYFKKLQKYGKIHKTKSIKIKIADQFCYENLVKRLEKNAIKALKMRKNQNKKYKKFIEFMLIKRKNLICKEILRKLQYENFKQKYIKYKEKSENFIQNSNKLIELNEKIKLKENIRNSLIEQIQDEKTKLLNLQQKNKKIDNEIISFENSLRTEILQKDLLEKNLSDKRQRASEINLQIESENQQFSAKKSEILSDVELYKKQNNELRRKYKEISALIKMKENGLNDVEADIFKAKEKEGKIKNSLSEKLNVALSANEKLKLQHEHITEKILGTKLKIKEAEIENESLRKALENAKNEKDDKIYEKETQIHELTQKVFLIYKFL